ncbi:MAG TPA: HAD family phosphatase [Candidatus Saccharimonadales bacterium]|nr:HAD family phosphatase [Candidatus Saccharimonadales bacterium]
MIRALIFDCFGVIVTDAFSNAYQQFGGDPVADNQFITDTVAAYNRGYISGEESVALFAERLGTTPQAWCQHVEQGEVRDQQMLAYITACRKTYKVAMLSNIGRNSLLRRFSQQELDNYFDEAVASGDIGIAKPDLRAYRIVVERLGVAPEETVMIDDSQANCEGAVAAGLQAVHYTDLPRLRERIQALADTE